MPKKLDGRTIANEILKQKYSSMEPSDNVGDQGGLTPEEEAHYFQLLKRKHQGKSMNDALGEVESEVEADDAHEQLEDLKLKDKLKGTNQAVEEEEDMDSIVQERMNERKDAGKMPPVSNQRVQKRMNERKKLK